MEEEERGGTARLLEEQIPKRICARLHGGLSTAFLTDTRQIPRPARAVLEL